MRGGLRCEECAGEEFPAGEAYPVPMDGPRQPWLRVEAPLLVCAVLFFAVAFVPVWYRVGGEEVFGLTIPSSRQDAWGGATLFAAIAAGAAIVWLILRRLWLGGRGVVVDLSLAVAGLAGTAIGLFMGRQVPNAEAGASWGFLAGLPITALWVWAAVRRYRRALLPARTSGFAA